MKIDVEGRLGMRADVLVYISGPISPKGEIIIEQHVAVAVLWYLQLIRGGVPAFCPHLSAAFPSAFTEVSYGQWLAYDLTVIDRCTHMLMLPRWELSKGALYERAYAERKGIPIFEHLQELMEAL